MRLAKYTAPAMLAVLLSVDQAGAQPSPNASPPASPIARCDVASSPAAGCRPGISGLQRSSAAR